MPFGYLAISSVADRYAYLPALGAALAMGDLISRFDPEKEGPSEWPGMLARGLATATSIENAFLAALECDPVSAFGGIVGTNRPVTELGLMEFGEKPIPEFGEWFYASVTIVS